MTGQINWSRHSFTRDGTLCGQYHEHDSPILITGRYATTECYNLDNRCQSSIIKETML